MKEMAKAASSSQKHQRRSHRHAEDDKTIPQEQNIKLPALATAIESTQPQQETKKPKSNIQIQCLKLLEAKQYKSCEILAMMELSQWNESTNSALCIATTMEILGDCFMAKGEYARAISYYRLAVLRRQCKSGNKRKDMSSNGVSSREEAVLRYKESQCLASIGGTVAACTILENVVVYSAPGLHTFEMSMELGNLYVLSGRKVDAIRMYQNTLDLNPYALEAVEKLSSLQRDAHIDEERVKSSIPYPEIAAVYFQSHRNVSSSISLWKKINEDYPNHLHFLLHLAHAYIHLGDDARAEEVRLVSFKLHF